MVSFPHVVIELSKHNCSLRLSKGLVGHECYAPEVLVGNKWEADRRRIVAYWCHVWLNVFGYPFKWFYSDTSDLPVPRPVPPVRLRHVLTPASVSRASFPMVLN